MSSARPIGGLKPEIVALRDRLREARAALADRRCKAMPAELSSDWAAAIDRTVVELLERAQADERPAPGGGLALVALGGYGRRDVAPFSDVDLMLLHEKRSAHGIESLAARFFRDLYDAGLQVGHSVRSVDEALSLASSDATVCTALMESRVVAGDEDLAQRLLERFARRCRRRRATLLERIDQARRSERIEFGDTVYLLEPNVKRSPGALRDVQFIRWLSYLSVGTTQLDELEFQGLASAADVAAVHEAWQFLLGLRISLHALAGKPGDVLDRPAQLALSAERDYRQGAGLMAVERLMREYFRRTSTVRRVGQELFERLLPPRRGSALVGLLLSHQLEGDFRVGPWEIAATRRGQAKLRADPAQALRLADLANALDKRIGREALRVIRDAAPGYPREITPAAAAHFLSLLDRSTRLEELLRALHDVGVLELVAPGFARARGLLQFNEYHKYTVDEHCLKAVGCATDFAREASPPGDAYRGLRSKRLLHLALLVHDLGKGYDLDHSEVGRRMAEELAARLRLPARDAETLVFLVHRHLWLSHLAFRRDTSDEQLLLRFAVEVGTPERLRMLYLLTVADLAAVGPGVRTPWKDEILTDVYRRALRHLAADEGSELPRRGALDVLAALAPDDDSAWFSRQWTALSAAYREALAPSEIVAQLRSLKALAPGETRAAGRYVDARNTTDYTIAAEERVASGIFHRLCGALTGQGLTILSAEINTLEGGLILDRFSTLDPDHVGPPPRSRIDEVCGALTAALRNPERALRVRRRLWRPGAGAPRLTGLPTQVRIDNATSERFTVIDVFAADAPGLLYEIARTLYELELSVGVAKIGTYLDQVVDVFYVTDRSSGERIVDEQRLETIRDRLRSAVEAAHAAG